MIGIFSHLDWKEDVICATASPTDSNPIDRLPVQNLLLEPMWWKCAMVECFDSMWRKNS